MREFSTVLCSLFFSFLLVTCTDQASAKQPLPVIQAEAPDLESQVSAMVDENRFTGVVLAVRGDQTILERHYSLEDPAHPISINPDSRFAIGSITKTFTAVLTLQLIESGKLGLDDTLQTHLPSYTADYSERITIRHLLQNRSGIPHYIDLPGWFDNDYKRTLTQDVLLSAIAALPLKFEPGSDYLYSNANYYLLGLIIEKIEGAPYDRALENRILSPLGLDDTGQIYEPPPITGLVQNYLRENDGSLKSIPIVNPQVFRATGSQYSNANDLLRWAASFQAETLLTAESKALMLAPDAPMAWDVLEAPINDGETMQLITYNGELAGYTSIITLFPEHDGIIIILNNNNAGYAALATMTLAIASQMF